MTDNETEKTPGGDRIHRYGPSMKPFQAALDSPDIEKIEQHIEKYIGKIETVFHEIASHLVHVDVLVVKPTPQRNFYTLITSGMSHQPMKPPPQVEQCKFAELLICLPPEWPGFTEKYEVLDKANWPVQLLKMLARFPHEYDTWLWNGHTMPNGDPPKPYADGTKLSGMIIAPPLLVPKGFHSLEIDANKTIFFFSILPIYPEEMDCKLKKGSNALFKLLDEHKVTELLIIDRPSVCKKSWRPFGIHAS